jgi:hypothetical protein
MSRSYFKICTSLTLLAILLGVGFAGRASVPSASPSAVYLSSGQTHLGHPMVPVPPIPGSASPLSAPSGPLGCPFSSDQCASSYNWGGYAVCVPQTNCQACLSGLSSCNPATPGTVSEVQGSWVVPTIVGASSTACPDSTKSFFDISTWVGIDGFVDQTVEQTGTSADCYYGQVYYYAWYEFYPAASVLVPFAVHSGDTIKAEVSYSSTTGNFTATITDVTTHQTLTTPSTAVPGAELSSAEWISESAYEEAYPSLFPLGLLMLTHVSQVSFTDARATIGGVTHTIAGWAPDDYWLLMVNSNFGDNQETSTPTPSTETLANAKAQPLGLGTGGGNFDVKWLSSGW